MDRLKCLLTVSGVQAVRHVSVENADGQNLSEKEAKGS